MSKLTTIKRKTDLEKIQDYYAENKPLPPRAKTKLTRMKAAHAYLLEGHSRAQTVAMLLETFAINSDTVGYEIVRDTVKVFGEINEAEQKGMRHILTERFERLYQKAWEASDWDTCHKILKEIGKIHGLHDGQELDPRQFNLPRQIIFTGNPNVLIGEG